jgi:ribose 5-phosphate isomerase B
MKISMGSDHAGFELKEIIKEYLSKKDIEIVDFGCYSSDRVDYPDYAHKVANSLVNDCEYGILVCGSGNGISMAANKHNGIRAAVCWNTELAILSRQHNDANILSLPARFISNEESLSCVDLFLSTEFEGGRHTDRVEKIDWN